MLDIDPVIFFLIFILVIASAADLLYCRIPNWLTFAGLAAGIAYSSFTKGYEGLAFSLLGAFAGFSLLIILYFIGGIGAGDVKLLGAVGSFVGPKGVFMVFMFSCILAGLYALILIASKGMLLGTLKRYGNILKGIFFTRQFIYIPPGHKEKELKLRYAFTIALGTFIYFAFGTPFSKASLRIFS
jgi:prepilin peptidase CpaA